jgi:hypothetical protein
MVGPGYLLDVNALLALFWPTHEDHEKVRTWFRANAARHWATCPITQAGFVRLASNPAITPDAVSVSEALELLGANLRLPGHLFWPDDLDVSSSLSLCGSRLQGYRQITDAYLLGLALHRKGHFVTLDRSISSLMSSANRNSTRVIDLSTANRRPN